MSKEVKLGKEAREKLMKGIDTLADAVVATLGPNGRCVLYEDYGEIKTTKDGVTVARKIEDLKDPIENMGAKLIKQASIKSANKAGDGTTTSTLLTREIIKLGLNHLNEGKNAVEIKKGIDTAVKTLITYIKENIKEDISSEEQLEQIATISANNDVEIGKLIAMALDKVGKDGIVHIEESKTEETYLETVEGMQFDRGYKSHYFVTDNNTMTAVLDNPYILIYDGKITQAKDLLPLLDGVSSKNSSLLIIAEDVESEALATLIVNKGRGVLKVAAIKAPDFGDRRKLIMDDIAVLTGGEVISREKGMKLDKLNWDSLGNARKVTITKDKTTIIDGKYDDTKLTDRIEELQKQIELAKTPFEMEKLQERLAKMVGGVSVIHVGGNSEVELLEKKDRVEDALHATKAAIEEGIIPGGGTALLKAKKTIDPTILGQDIIYNVCSKPLEQILSNAGYDDLDSKLNSRSVEADVNLWTGINVKTGALINMKTEGIIDPFKVLRIALESASSIAGTILLTEAIIIENKEEKTNNQPGMEGMGGMF
jgi:chaperonin GroEL